MSRAMVALLAREMDGVWNSFCDALQGLTEAEYHWRPTPDALTFDDLVPPDSAGWRAMTAFAGPADNQALADTRIVERELYARGPAPLPSPRLRTKSATWRPARSCTRNTRSVRAG